MQEGGDSNGQDGRGDRNPPDEEQIRLGRSRVARGFDPTDEGRPLDPAGAPGGLIGGTAPGTQPFAQASRPPAPVQPSDAIDLSPRFRAWSEPGPAGAGPMRCHFLRTVGPDGRLAEAQRTAVPTHRCAAFGDPLPLSLRQQELVCLQRVHVSCPRYVRGTLLANENQSQPKPQDKREGGVPLWTIAGVALVILSLVILSSTLLGFGPLSGGGAQPSLIAAASASPSRSAAVTQAPTASPTASPTARPTVTATATARATASASPTANATWTPAASPTWPPGGTASRMDLLVACSDQPNCWVYTVHGAGPPPNGNGSAVADTLAGVIKFFGVSLASVQQMNPWLNGGTTITPGDKLKIPTPTKWS